MLPSCPAWFDWPDRLLPAQPGSAGATQWIPANSIVSAKTRAAPLRAPGAAIAAGAFADALALTIFA